MFYEKVHGDGTMKSAEPIADIHMPNGSILPFIMAIGLYIAGFGVIMKSPYWELGGNGLIVLIAGLAITYDCWKLLGCCTTTYWLGGN